MATPAPAPAPAPVIDTKSWFDKLKEFIFIPVDKVLLRSAPEIGHLAPIISIFGTLFFAALTLNPSIALMGVGAIEASLLHSVLGTLGAFFTTPFAGVKTEVDSEKEAKCSSVFQTVTPSRFKLFLESGLRKTWPNAPLYYLSFFAAYCIESMLFYNKETENLGPAYSNRPYLASIAAILLLSLYFVYLLVYGCEGMFSMIFSIVTGIVVGLLICMTHYAIFGKENVNVMFIPPIMRKENLDYVCVATAK